MGSLQQSQLRQSLISLPGYSTLRCVVEYIFLNELVLPCRNEIGLRQSFHVVIPNWSKGYMRKSLFVIVFFEHHAPSVQITVHNTQANIGILAYHVETSSRSNKSDSYFHIWKYNNSDVVRKRMPNLPYNMKLSGLL